MLNFKKERINTKKVLGKGAFGVVRPYQKNETDQKWAVKIIKAYDFEDVLKCFKEITLGFSCDNPYVLPIRGYLIEQDNMGEWNVCLKLPRMHKGSLRDVLNDHKKDKKLIPEIKIAQYFCEIVCGLQYLHGKNIAHRDIKPENILFDENGTIKIADFGIGDINEGNTTYALAEKAGALFYAAPENRDMNADLHKKDLFATDLWSLGMVMFELCTQLEFKQLISSTSGEKLEEVLKEKLIELEREDKYSGILIELILSLLRWKSTDRRNLREVHEQLVCAYGTQLKMNYHSKGAQTDSDDRDQGLRARLQELEKKLEERDAYIEGIETHYKGIVADLENQLKKMQNEVVLSNGETKKKQNQIKVERLEEKPIHQEKMQKSTKKFDLFMKELERKTNAFYIQESENGINVFPISQGDVTDENIKELAIQIGTHLKALQHLSLNFVICGKITHESVKELAIQIGTNLKTLQHLSLNFESCDKISDESVKEMAIQIGTHLKTLQHLSLNFYRCDKITDESIKELAIQIGTNLKTLQNLNLDFSWCYKITGESVKELAIQIGTNLKTLQHLSLNFYGCGKITHESVKELAIQIGTNLKTLQHLSLIFASCQNIGDESVKELALQIGTNLKTLQHLSLYFQFCNEVSDESIKELANQIGTNLKTLQHLNLNFKCCNKITDKSVNELAIQIGTNLKTLQHLSLNFDGCDKITDKSIKGLTNQIGTNLKTLQHLSLNFSLCTNINDESVKELAMQIGTNLKELKELCLCFKRTSVSSKLKDAIRSQFAHLKKNQLFID